MNEGREGKWSRRGEALEGMFEAHYMLSYLSGQAVSLVCQLFCESTPTVVTH